MDNKLRYVHLAYKILTKIKANKELNAVAYLAEELQKEYQNGADNDWWVQQEQNLASIEAQGEEISK